MAASGFTPISLYYSTTAAAAPTAGNLTNGELAINITDGKLYYKDNAGVVQLLASKAALTSVDSISFGTTGLTPNTATTGAVTVAGTLVASNGGTGQSSYTIGDLLYASSTTALSKLADVATGNALISGGVGAAPSWGKIGLTTHVSGTLAVGNGGTGATTLTSNGVVYGNGTSAVGITAAGTTGQVLVGNTGAAPSWATVSSTLVSSFSGGTTGLTPSTATTGAVTLAGTLVVANGGTGATTAANARTNLGASTLGANVFTITNPSAITFPRFNADNTVSALDAATFRTAIGAGTGSGTVTGVTATSPVASSGGTAPVISLSSAYGDTLNPYGSKTANFFLAAPNGTAGAPTFRAIVAADIPTLNQNTTGTAANVTGTVAIANGGTGSTTASGARTNLGATTLGGNLFTITNPSAVTFPRFNADNTVSALDAASFRTAIGAGTGGGSVFSVDVSGGTTGLTTSGGPITSSGTITLAGTLGVANGGTGLTSLTAGRIPFGAGTSAFGSSANLFWDNTNGYLGIGTSSPTNALSVTGNANITGNTTLGDASTDSVQVNGYMGVGIAPSANVGLFTRPSGLTTTTQIGVLGGVLANSSATSLVAGVYGEGRTAASAFTVSDLAALYANNTTKGAGSTITNQHGVFITDQTQGTNNYGITSLVSSGTNKWNIYASGTASNYFAGNVGIGATSAAVKLVVSSTDAVKLPVGTTAQRPTGASGYIRFNSDTSGFEGYNGTAWAAVGGGNTTSNGLWENAITISSNYTITSGNNAMSAGPITVASGVTVTVPSGSVWTIV